MNCWEVRFPLDEDLETTQLMSKVFEYPDSIILSLVL